MFRMLTLALVLSACGGTTSEASSETTAKPTSSGTVATAKPTEPAVEVGPDGPADLDVPALGAISADEHAIHEGEEVFRDHGCAACHQFGNKLVGPDLAGVTTRRTAPWIAKMVLYPEKMTKQDPVAKDLYRQAMVQMTDQKVPREDIPDLIAFLASKQTAP